MGRRGKTAASLAIGLTAVLAGCALTPTERFDRLAAAYGFERTVVPGSPFYHVTYRNRMAPPPPSPSGGGPTTAADGHAGHRVGHIYIGGDGSPWLGHTRVASDPTPRRPLALKLMALDPWPSVYVGRPCYHGLSPYPPCHPHFWTDARYSAAVVDSLATVVDALVTHQPWAQVTLIGYSGGGTLAMLLAEQIERTVAVITVSANLDTEAWTVLHRYSPLRTSLNPAERSPLPARIVQLHLAGALDRNVPPRLIAPVVARQANARLRVVADFDHRCCWTVLWQGILSERHNDRPRALTPAPLPPWGVPVPP